MDNQGSHRNLNSNRVPPKISVKIGFTDPEVVWLSAVFRQSVVAKLTEKRAKKIKLA
jgi:hypothetical protein